MRIDIVTYALINAQAAVALAAALAAGTACAQAADAKYAGHLADLVNAYRTEKGLPPLAVDRTLTALAVEHSSDMAKAHRMSHDEFQSRVRRSGLAMCVENVGWNYASAQSQFDAWRKSSGHDRNMLDRRVQRVGVGMVDDYVTLMACGV
jgi:uncharacterized protein YkwD